MTNVPNPEPRWGWEHMGGGNHGTTAVVLFGGTEIWVCSTDRTRGVGLTHPRPTPFSVRTRRSQTDVPESSRN